LQNKRRAQADNRNSDQKGPHGLAWQIASLQRYHYARLGREFEHKMDARPAAIFLAKFAKRAFGLKLASDITLPPSPAFNPPA
jgi:hypothetical protein